MQTIRTSRWVIFATAAVLALIIALTPLAAQDDARIPITPAASFVSDGSPAGDGIAAFFASPTAPSGAAFSSDVALVGFTLPSAEEETTETGDPTSGYQVVVTVDDAPRFTVTQPILEALSARPEGVTGLPVNLNQALNFWALLTFNTRPTLAVEFSVDGARALLTVTPHPTESETYYALVAIDLGESYTFISTSAIPTSALSAELQAFAGFVATIDLDGDGEIAPAVVSPEATAAPEATVEPEATAEPTATTAP